MTDREKVIKGLQCCFTTANCDGCPYEIEFRKISFKISKNHCPILDDVLALLKEQARKPAKVVYTDYGVACGSCGFLLQGGDQNFCPKCGAEVDWE